MSNRLTTSMILASLTLSHPALAEDDQRQRAAVDAAPIAERAPVNAALRYWPQWYFLESAFAERPDADPKLAFTGEASDAARSAEAIVREHAQTLDAIVDVSRLTAVNWGTEIEKGPRALLSHLTPLRRSALLLLADARRLIQDGKGAAAAERLASAFRMAGHATGGDDFLISSLVSIAVFESAARETTAALDAGALNPDAQRTVARALDRFPTSDPFGARSSIQEEGKVFTAWLRAEAASNDPSRRNALVAFFAENSDDDDAASNNVRAMIQRNEPLNPFFWLLEKAYKEADAAWSAPNADEALAALSDRVGAGEFGPIAQVFFPALNKVKSSDNKAQSTLAALRARLAQP